MSASRLPLKGGLARISPTRPRDRLLLQLQGDIIQTVALAVPDPLLSDLEGHRAGAAVDEVILTVFIGCHSSASCLVFQFVASRHNFQHPVGVLFSRSVVHGQIGVGVAVVLALDHRIGDHRVREVNPPGYIRIDGAQGVKIHLYGCGLSGRFLRSFGLRLGHWSDRGLGQRLIGVLPRPVLQPLPHKQSSAHKEPNGAHGNSGPVQQSSPAHGQIPHAGGKPGRTPRRAAPGQGPPARSRSPLAHGIGFTT